MAWTMILKHNTQFFVTWGPHDVGDHVQVKLGGGGDACLTLPTRTLANAGVTVDPNVFWSVQTQTFSITSRPHIERVTSPEAGLQTRFAAAGVIVTPTTQTVPSTSPPASTPTPTPTSTRSSVTPPSSDPDSTSSSDEQETASSHSGQTSGSRTSVPTSGSTEANFAPAPTSSNSPNDTEHDDKGDQQEGISQPVDPGPAVAHSASKTPIIVGAAVGGTLFLLAIACCFILTLRRRRDRHNTGASPFMLMVESGTEQNATTATANSMARESTRWLTVECEINIDYFTAMIDVESTRTTLPLAAGAKHADLRRASLGRFFNSESAPTESEYSASHRASGSVPMDLARALAVVAAHVRSGEGVQVDPTGAPPEYSRTIMSTSSGTTAVAAVPIVRERGIEKPQPSVVRH